MVGVMTLTALVQAFYERMGLHTGVFRGYSPTGKPVQWLGAALFHGKSGVISSLWVLGDLAGLDSVLEQNSAAQHGAPGDTENPRT
jgi:hypothetical protein